MTVNDANLLVKKLVGDDDFHDVSDVLASYYDIAQREIATTAAPIRKTIKVLCGVSVALPKDVYRLANVSAGYVRDDINHITVEGVGEAVVCYLAYPQRIGENTDGTYEFEVCAEAQSAIPYFAAAQTVLADSDMRRYYAFMDAFNSILANVAESRMLSAKITVVRTEEM